MGFRGSYEFLGIPGNQQSFKKSEFLASIDAVRRPPMRAKGEYSLMVFNDFLMIFKYFL